jgi:hypothetical protein
LTGAADFGATTAFAGTTAARLGAAAATTCDFFAAGAACFTAGTALLGRAAGADFNLRVDGIAVSLIRRVQDNGSAAGFPLGFSGERTGER